jgi:hypothetical protein
VTSTTAFQVRVTLRSFDNIREGRYDALVTNGDYVLPGESGGGGQDAYTRSLLIVLRGDASAIALLRARFY